MEGQKNRNIRKARIVRDGVPAEFEMDFKPPKTEWVDHNDRPKDWWFDTEYGPDDNYPEKGPLDDDNHPVLVINREGFTRERYMNDNVQEFIMEVKTLLPTDVWVEIYPKLKATLQLCKQDTSIEDRDGLIAKGFKYLGSRCDLMYFEEPEVPQIEGNVRTYPIIGVQIRIQRGKCFCSSYHKEPFPGAFDYSQVALNGDIDSMVPPLQREKTAEEKEEDVKRQEEVRISWEETKKKAEAGDARSQYLMMLNGIKNKLDSVVDELEKEALEAGKKFQEDFIKKKNEEV